MVISKDKVVVAHYILKDDQGEVLDSSTDDHPMSYLHGSGKVLDGIEKALEGKRAGEQCQIVLKAEQAYGQPDPKLIEVVDKAMFNDVEDLDIGTVFHAETEDGVMEYEVVEIKGNKVTIDGNHPLAGETLHFEIDIVEVREATHEEIERGQVHGEEGDN